MPFTVTDEQIEKLKGLVVDLELKQDEAQLATDAVRAAQSELVRRQNLVVDAEQSVRDAQDDENAADADLVLATQELRDFIDEIAKPQTV